MNHEEAQIAIERRRRGALDEAEVRALDAHLAECAECRDYGALSSATEENMTSQTATGLNALDWTTLTSRLHRMVDRTALQTWVCFVAVACGIPLVLLPSLSHFVHLVGGILLVGGVGALVSPLSLARRRFARLAMTAPKGELLVAWRAELDRRIRQRLRTIVVNLVAVGLTVAVEWDDARASRSLFIALWMLVIADGAYAVFYALPRLRRERAELGD